MQPVTQPPPTLSKQRDIFPALLPHTRSPMYTHTCNFRARNKKGVRVPAAGIICLARDKPGAGSPMNGVVRLAFECVHAIATWPELVVLQLRSRKHRPDARSLGDSLGCVDVRLTQKCKAVHRSNDKDISMTELEVSPRRRT